jgi:hypothetical protein
VQDDIAFTDEEVTAKPGCPSRMVGHKLRVIRRTWEMEIAHE